MYSRFLASIALTLLIFTASGVKPRATQAANSSGAGTTFVVNSTGDGSDSFLNGTCDTTPVGGETVCTLRAAIQEANRTPELDVIEFNIKAPGNIGIIPYAATIKPTSALPRIEHPTIIDGRTQPQGIIFGEPGSACATSSSDTHNLLITLDGDDGTGIALDFAGAADGSAVYGLAIVNFPSIGIRSIAGDLTIQCNHIGILRDGVTAAPNLSYGINVSSVRNVLIGGPDAADRNVVSGNRLYGMLISSVAETTVQGNYIGTDETGGSAVPNSANATEPAGILLRNAGLSDGNTIGPGNIVGGNIGHGILIEGSAETDVIGNRIGVGSINAGSPAIPNTGSGLFLLDATSTLIGGETIFDDNGNIIANNGVHGIEISGGSSSINIENNSVRDNTQNGILIDQSTGTAIGSNNNGNSITRNGHNGIEVRNTASSATRIENNSIGITSGIAFAAGNELNGIFINESSGVTIGDSPARGSSSGNTIGANPLNGILVSGDDGRLNTIDGNTIGTTNGTSAYPNGASGILITDGARLNQVGTVAANTIRFNTGNGITVDQSAYVNRIRGNSISQNGLLGIDLGNDGVTTNDVDDVDGGPNRLMNFPTISGVELTGSTLVVSGTLNTVVSPGTFAVDLFVSSDCDASGYGEGEQFFNAETFAGSDGNLEFAISTESLIPPEVGDYVTLTATDPTGNTSEFSKCAQIFSTPTAVTLQAEQAATGRYLPITLGVLLLLGCGTLGLAVRRSLAV